MDRWNNQYGAPFVPADEAREKLIAQGLKDSVYLMDEPRRVIVRDAIVKDCKFRKWKLLALHVRTNHVHMVICADEKPERVMVCAKSYASQALNHAGMDHVNRKRWARHGSTLYLWTEANVQQKISYTLHMQGNQMAIYDYNSECKPVPSYSGKSE